MKLSKLRKLSQALQIAVLALVPALAACGGTEEDMLLEEENGSEVVVPIRTDCTPKFNRCNKRCEKLTDPAAQDGCYTSCGEQLQVCINCSDPLGCFVN